MFNLPNCITLTRIFCVIVFTCALAWDAAAPAAAAITPEFGGMLVPLSTARGIAFWAFVLGAISDFFDGYLARRLNQVTNFGKLIDPLADKILVSAAYIYLTEMHLCPFWVTIIIIFREFLVTGIRQLAVAQGYVMAADWCGKWKTGFQLAYSIDCLLLLAYGGNLFFPLPDLLFGGIGEGLRAAFLWISLILTLWSGANYCFQARRFIRG